MSGPVAVENTAPTPQSSVAVSFSEDELLALAAALDGNRAPGMLGAAIDKVSRAALDVIHASRATRRAVKS